MLFPTMVERAALRPSRMVIRMIIAVAGPGVKVTSRAITKNSGIDLTCSEYLGPPLRLRWRLQR
jgi:hypothetical protein